MREDMILDINYEKAKLEIRNFVNDGLMDVQRGALCDFDETFNRLESRYQEKEVAIV